MAALVIRGKVYVAWKRKMLHDVALLDVIRELKNLNEVHDDDVC